MLEWYYQVAVLQIPKLGETFVFVDCIIIGHNAFPVD